jgi:hypothetical protein
MLCPYGKGNEIAKAEHVKRQKMPPLKDDIEKIKVLYLKSSDPFTILFIRERSETRTTLDMFR